MLVITRRIEDVVTIATNTGAIISVKVIEVYDGKCKLGIEAPKDFAISRDNMVKEKQK